MNNGAISIHAETRWPALITGARALLSLCESGVEGCKWLAHFRVRSRSRRRQ